VLLLLLAVVSLVFITGLTLGLNPQLILGAVGLVVVGFLLGRSAFGWGANTKTSTRVHRHQLP
jgi:hypothetical protein